MPLHIVRQDITKMQVDAIVNTTNANMVGLSGVDLAVHLAAGNELDEECKKIAPLGLGEVKLTKGYNLPAGHIIHTSGPIWQGGLQGESIILRSCYTKALELAVKQGFESIAFPLISSGAYGYPKDKVLKFAIETITEFLKENELIVYLCVYDKTSYSFSRALYEDIVAYIDDFYVAQCRKASFPDILACQSTVYREALPQADHAPPAKAIKQKKSYNFSSLENYLKRMDRSFQKMLFDLIDERDMTDVQCYKKANIDKKTFSKIKCNKNYKPSKQTAIAFAISLELDLEETQKLLATVSYTLSDSSTFDKIIKYFIHKEIYDIFVINEALFEFDQMLLGSL